MKEDKEKEIPKTFILRIEEEVKVKAENRAKETNRSLNGHIINLIKNDLELTTTNG